MAKKCRLIALAVLLVLTLTTPSYAWFDAGHMAVAYLAYQDLSQPVKDRIDDLLRLNPSYKKWRASLPSSTSEEDKRMLVFIIAATWPDQIKSDHTYRDDGSAGGNIPDGPSSSLNIGYKDHLRHKYWHFVDLPLVQDGTKLTKKQKKVPSPNALTQINAFRAVLASNRPDALKSYDLVWLLHLVGDVHQPLHCTQRFGKTQPTGDAGGNFVKLCDAPCKDVLHAFWDGLLGDNSSPFFAVKVGKGLPEADSSLAGIGDAKVWIDESFKLASEDVYVDPPIGLGAGPFTITEDYRTKALEIARARVALGGARLANILKTELK